MHLRLLLVSLLACPLSLPAQKPPAEVEKSLASILAQFPTLYIDALYGVSEPIRRRNGETIDQKERTELIEGMKVIDAKQQQIGEVWRATVQMKASYNVDDLLVFELDHMQGVWIPHSGWKIDVANPSKKTDLFAPNKLLPMLPLLGALLEKEMLAVQKGGNPAAITEGTAKPAPVAGKPDPRLVGVWTLLEGRQNFTEGSKATPPGSVQMLFTEQEAAMMSGIFLQKAGLATKPDQEPAVLILQTPSGEQTQGIYRFPDKDTLEMVQTSLAAKGTPPQTFADSSKAGYVYMRFKRVESPDKERYQRRLADGATQAIFQQWVRKGAISKVNDKGDIEALAFNTIPLGPKDTAVFIMLSRLNQLVLLGNQLSEESTRDIGQIKTLKSLSIAVNHLNDDRLKLLAGLDLEELDVSMNFVGDKSVPVLAGFKNLKRLKINTLTPAGVGALKAALPNCEISK